MDKDRQLADSWNDNASNWTRAVRDGLIPSRQAGTDAAILDTIVARAPVRLLDIGCGEGWLIRAASERISCAGVGLDGSASLIEAARAADPRNRYFLLDYATFSNCPWTEIGGKFDVVTFNYALFSDDISALLKAAARRLSRDGVIIIQTLHPGSEKNEDEWRNEDFFAFQGDDWAPMPWYFRTLDSWRAALSEAGLVPMEMREPSTPDGRTLSLMMICSKDRIETHSSAGTVR
jgi:SAM-dependent methyltransferase